MIASGKYIHLVVLDGEFWRTRRSKRKTYTFEVLVGELCVASRKYMHLGFSMENFGELGVASGKYIHLGVLDGEPPNVLVIILKTVDMPT